MKRLISLITLPLMVVAAILIFKPPYITPSLGDKALSAPKVTGPLPAPNVSISEVAGFARIHVRHK